MIRIALYYPMRLGLWQRVIRGIFAYARPAKPWVFSMAVHEDPKLLLKWKPDAIIGQVETPRAVEVLKKVDIPLVDTSYSVHQLQVPRVRFDDCEIGRLAAKYLLDRGFENLAFVGSPEVAFEVARRDGVLAEVARHGRACLSPPDMVRSLNQPDDLGPVGKRMMHWLEQAPKPLAIVAAVDPLALRISEACLAIGLRIPEDVALLGVNNDELICNLAFPPLSSVRLAATQLGFEAAKLLDGWLETGKPKSEDRILKGADVVTRQSTDIYATADDVLNQALRFIRDHAAERVSVGDVVNALDVSRSSLERRFKALLKRSPLDEIRRVQLQQAKQLLIESNLTMPEIARASGFRDGKHFAMAFRKRLQTSPSDFRRTHAK